MSKKFASKSVTRSIGYREFKFSSYFSCHDDDDHYKVRDDEVTHAIETFSYLTPSRAYHTWALYDTGKPIGHCFA